MCSRIMCTFRSSYFWKYVATACCACPSYCQKCKTDLNSLCHGTSICPCHRIRVWTQTAYTSLRTSMPNSVFFRNLVGVLQRYWTYVNGRKCFQHAHLGVDFKTFVLSRYLIIHSETSMTYGKYKEVLRDGPVSPRSHTWLRLHILLFLTVWRG